MLFIETADGRRVLVKRPSIAHYERLVVELAGAGRALQQTTSDPLAVGAYALAIVIEFLQSDRTMLEANITRPLALILNALNDCRRGGKPPLLFDRRKTPGRPTNQSFDAVKGAIAVAIDVLLSARMKRPEAGRYVADCAREEGIRHPDGKEISSRTALGWRDEIEISRSEIGAEVFKRLKAFNDAKGPVSDVRKAKEISKNLLRQVQHAGL